MPAPTRPPHIDDEKFLAHVTDRLAALPAVPAIALGGSMAQGTHQVPTVTGTWRSTTGAPSTPTTCGPSAGRVRSSEIGGWGGGVFNGGAWLTVESRRVDVHYRDLDVVERESGRAELGRFHVEPLLFHLAGIPSYLLVAELAVNRVLRGDLPRPAAYPAKLRISASAHWHGTARATLAYAKANHAPAGRLTEAAGSAGDRRPADRSRGAGGAWGVGDEREAAARAGRVERDRRDRARWGGRPEGLVHVLGRAEVVLDAAVVRAEEVADDGGIRAEEILDAGVDREGNAGCE